jgi:hypothetical protein
LQEQEAAGAQAIGRDLVSGEGGPGEGIDWLAGRAAGDRRPAEVARALEGGGHELRARGPALLAVQLLGDEEVELVVDQGAAEGPAEVVAIEGVLGLARLLQEVVRGVQRVVAPEVEGAAVERVLAAAGDDVDLRARGLAELGAVAVAMDLELLDGLDRGVDEDRAVAADVVVVGAVDRPHVGVDRAPGDGEVDAAHEALVGDVEARLGLADAGHQQRELDEVAAVERQLADLLAGDEAGDVAALGLHLDGGGLDADRLRHAARLELDVLGAHVGHVEQEALVEGALESGVAHLDLVAADGEVGEGVGPDRARERALRQTGVFALQGDLRPRDHRPRGVRHRPAQRGAGALGEHRGRDQGGENRQEYQRLAHPVLLD